MGRQAYSDRGNPGEEGDDRQQERGVAPRQEQEDNEERTGRDRNDRDRPPAGITPRTASAMVSGASTPVAMINRNAIPCTQPCQVAGFPPVSIGTSTLKGGQD